MKAAVLGAGLVAAAVAVGAAVPARSPQAAATSGGKAWLHVRVEEPGESSRVSVNLPLGVVEAALQAAPEKIVSEGRIHLGGAGTDLSVADLRNLWTQLREAGDTEIVSVVDKGEKVTVARVGSLVQVRVNDTDKREEVHVDVPVAFVDALLSSSGDELNVKAGIHALKTLRGDIVRVRDEQTSVRIWIDEAN